MGSRASQTKSKPRTGNAAAVETGSVAPTSTGAKTTIERAPGRPANIQNAPKMEVTRKSSPIEKVKKQTTSKKTQTPKAKSSDKPKGSMDAKTKALLGAAGVTGAVGAGAIGYNMTDDGR